jgi:hypothetical protein
MKYFSLLLLPMFVACEDAVTITEDDFASITYSFHDSSVPPVYHRSYDITVSPKDVRVQVDSYGDILAEDQFEISASDLSSLIKTINDAKLKSGNSGPNEGCDGGTSESLSIKTKKGNVYSGSFDHCDGVKIPESLGDVKAVIDAMKNLVPNLGTMLD